MKNIMIYLFLMLSTTAIAQQSVDKILADIAQNNKTIQANNQYLEAQALTFKTGLTPDNPQVAYEYLPGRPEGAGTQQDFSVTQAFDFPTTYGKKAQVSERQIIKTRFEVDAQRQEILWQAKTLCLELIYRNKLHGELTGRYNHVLALSRDFKTRLDRGEGNILDVNKANLQLLSIRTDLQVNESERNQLLHRLAELNGGLAVSLPETTYPILPALPGFDELDSLIEANDPVVKSYKQEKEVAQYQLSVTRSQALPRFEAGYHTQSILGQRYQGPHFGLTIPLWENHNRVKAQSANVVLSELKVLSHRNEHHYRNMQLYEQYLKFQKISEEYQAALATSNNAQLLDKALAQGEISSIEYFMELSYFYSAMSQSLLAEFELHKTIATLYKFQL